MKDPFRDISMSSKLLDDIARQQRMMDDILKPIAGLDLVDQFARGVAASGLMDEINKLSKLFEFTRSPAFMQAIEQANAASRMTDIAGALKLSAFVSPKIAEITHLSQIAAGCVAPFEGILNAQQDWDVILSGRMAAIDVDWALADEPEASAESFARLSRLSDVARLSAPYTDETSEIVFDELGALSASPDEKETVEVREDRYDDAGRERALIAFPPASYGRVMVSAGFGISFPEPPALSVEDGLFEPVQFSPETGYLLQSLEGHLRNFVSARLHALEGEAWIKRRVPQGVRAKWQEGRKTALAANKPAFALIHYSNFMDLADIIVAGNNWPEFTGVFPNQENLRVSLLRLYYIRNDIAHSRPISMTDMLVAMTEGTFMFRCLGLPVHYAH
ncbi:Swt1 family HEPN domain-containing protein [Rhizobium sp. PP-CC-3G-465]|uniref:Swt1 family HEPN domain-containing protein n=1 Tax=Rhizobium sp. PP-CC-3G-465 TaxID=2135648 RepID=UPI001044EAD3|nr:hypothetical protein C8J33_1362 [Rhizobium sp. PP-CC-3G-465]